MRAFAQKLRDLFSTLGISSRYYAENIAHVDVSALSRWCSGQRVPAWEHVDTLISEVNKARPRGSDLVSEHEIREIEQMYIEALEATDKPKCEAMALRRRIARLEEEVSASQAREQVLEEQLLAAQQTVTTLDTTFGSEMLALESGPRMPPGNAFGALALHGEEEKLSAQRVDLELLVQRLEQKLQDERKRRSDAEAECDELRARLRIAERDADPPDEEDLSQTERQYIDLVKAVREDLRRERRRRYQVESERDELEHQLNEALRGHVCKHPWQPPLPPVVGTGAPPSSQPRSYAEKADATPTTERRRGAM